MTTYYQYGPVILHQSMTSRQIEWAATHDWFVADNGDGSVTVRDDDVVTGQRIFTDFATLRFWAGY